MFFVSITLPDLSWNVNVAFLQLYDLSVLSYANFPTESHLSFTFSYTVNSASSVFTNSFVILSYFATFTVPLIPVSVAAFSIPTRLTSSLMLSVVILNSFSKPSFKYLSGALVSTTLYFPWLAVV